MPSYLLDFKNITNASGIQDCLRDWTLTRLSERTFKVIGREYNRTDLIRLYQFIGSNGHIFIYDFENGSEYFWPKHPTGRRQERAINSDLDTQTLQCITEFEASQQD